MMKEIFSLVKNQEVKMKFSRLVLLIMLFLTACNGGPKTTGEPSGTLPTPQVGTTSVPDVSVTAKDFLEKWKSEDYAGMYGMLAPTSRDAITQDAFTQQYSDAASNLTLSSLEYGIVSTLINPQSAKVAYTVVYHTALMGDLNRQMEMNLVIVNNAWAVQWDDGMIMPELKGGNKLMLDITYPSRGDIYDKNGEAIATQADAVALGLMPGQVPEDDFEMLFSQLSLMTGKTVQALQDLYNHATDWYVPVGEVSKDAYEKRAPYISDIPGLVTNEYTDRFYYSQGVAPQAIGYLQSIFPEQMEEYRRNGYAGDEKVGQAGIEKWGETYLAGKPGADLYVTDANGKVITRLASVDAQPAQSITTTLDKNLQVISQKALLGFTGAIVVLEKDTGKVLAMASSPGFDPNVFQTTNYNSQFQLGQVVSDAATPMWNRATQSGYPLGSVFKLVTASAALESGLYTPTTKYECTSQFTELPGFVGNDWTYDKGLPPSGTLSLLQGIMRSCNPWFYHLGLDLYRQKGATYLADMARGFGLGEATGIEGVAETPGQINDPTDEGGAVQMGIGQGDMLVTPLQVADFIAAIGNGGKLYIPQIIEKITNIDGTVTEQFTPQLRGELPVSQETLAALKEGMKMVVREEKGTAYRTFIGVNTPIFGKTGTATTSVEEPHAWFAGFTEAGRTDLPDIAIVVLAENSGDGSVYAAPIFRRVIEAYFTGEVYRLYPWESTFYVTKTPQPDEETTPTTAQ